MATSIQVVFDCADPDSLARFWAEAIGYSRRTHPPAMGAGSTGRATKAFPVQ